MLSQRRSTSKRRRRGLGFRRPSGLTAALLLTLSSCFPRVWCTGGWHSASFVPSLSNIATATAAVTSRSRNQKRRDHPAARSGRTGGSEERPTRSALNERRGDWGDDDYDDDVGGGRDRTPPSQTKGGGNDNVVAQLIDSAIETLNLPVGKDALPLGYPLVIAGASAFVPFSTWALFAAFFGGYLSLGRMLTPPNEDDDDDPPVDVMNLGSLLGAAASAALLSPAGLAASASSSALLSLAGAAALGLGGVSIAADLMDGEGDDGDYDGDYDRGEGASRGDGEARGKRGWRRQVDDEERRRMERWDEDFGDASDDRAGDDRRR